MIGALEYSVGATAAGLADLRAPVPAAVHQHVDVPAVHVPDHDDGSQPDGRGEIISGGPDLAFMADVNPGLPPDPLHFQLEDLFPDVDVPVHACRVDEGLQGFRLL